MKLKSVFSIFVLSLFVFFTFNSSVTHARKDIEGYYLDDGAMLFDIYQKTSGLRDDQYLRLYKFIDQNEKDLYLFQFNVNSTIANEKLHSLQNIAYLNIDGSGYPMKKLDSLQSIALFDLIYSDMYVIPTEAIPSLSKISPESTVTFSVTTQSKLLTHEVHFKKKFISNTLTLLSVKKEDFPTYDRYSETRSELEDPTQPKIKKW